MALLPAVQGLSVRVLESTEDLLSARRLHAACYVDAGYVETSDLDEHGFIDDQWVSVSDYYGAFDTEVGELVGTCRIIRPSVFGFPVFNECESYFEANDVFSRLDPNRCVEVSALATPRTGMQNTAISAALYGAVWQEALTNRRGYLLAFMDNRLLRIMRRWFHFPFEATGPSTNYMGSESTPVSLYIPRTIANAQEHHPENLDFFSGDIPLSEIDDVLIELRDSVPEHKAKVIDLRVQAAPVI